MEHFFPVLLVLVATMLTLPVHSQEEHNLESLASRIKQLENQHNQTQVATSTQSDIDRLQQQIHQLKHSILNSRVSGLQKESNSDPILLQNDINHLRSDTRDDIRQLKIDIQSIKNNSSQQFRTFQDSLDALNTTFSSPVNIYKDCRQDTQRCFLQAHYSVWHRCNTPSLPLNTTVSSVAYYGSIALHVNYGMYIAIRISKYYSRL